MQHPGTIHIKDFTYILPDDKIATHPLPQRDQSRLLVYNKKRIYEDVYANIAAYLPEHSLLVFNDTKVVEARLLFQKPTGATIEIFVLEPYDRHTYITTAMQQKGSAYWKCLIGGAGKWKHGQALHKQSSNNEVLISLQASITEKLADSFCIAFSWQPDTYTFTEVLHIFGVMPIPPYLKRQTDTSDQERYQTVYASREGSVAAPTAGLHFTASVFDTLQAKNINTEFITLHVGAGTFMPVKATTLQNHTMHAEYVYAEAALIHKLAAQAPDIFAVGTTSLRALESLYWMGVKCYVQPHLQLHELELKQWEVYDTLHRYAVGVRDALASLSKRMEQHHTTQLIIKTQLLIAPGYKARMVRGMITNFHQPDSTLLLLVAALIGEDWKKVYDYALQHNFRFLSYGDGCLLFAD